MCYQTRLIRKKEEIQQKFEVDISELNNFEEMEFCSAFDFPKTPVITNLEPKKVQLYNWGLIPTWSQDNSIRNYTLNARIETLNEKRSFKDVLQNRCLILADGFYEWQWLNESGSKKHKYLITLQQEELFAFAGIHSQWEDFDGKILHSYSMITTQANELMSEIHNTKQRMPIILKSEDEKQWLEGDDYNNYKYPYSCDLIATIQKNKKGNQYELF